MAGVVDSLFDYGYTLCVDRSRQCVWLYVEGLYGLKWMVCMARAGGSV